MSNKSGLEVQQLQDLSDVIAIQCSSFKTSQMYLQSIYERILMNNKSGLEVQQLQDPSDVFAIQCNSFKTSQMHLQPMSAGSQRSVNIEAFV